jgi:thiamine-phosphate pyrophosphorylase
VEAGIARRARLARSRLYLVLEARPHGEDPTELLDAALRGGVDVVQLRDKELPDDELVRAAEPFRRACDAHGALFVLNDRPDLIERTGADGVHVGQSDTPAVEARRVVGADRLVGISASTRDELESVPPEADYVGVGAVFGTPTKPESPPGGLELVRAARDLLRLPWFAIGGVDLETIAAVAGSGAYGAAVVRAIRDANDPEGAARALREALPPSGVVVGNEALLPQVELTEESAPRVGPHTHRVHTDVFYVLEGELEFRLADETARLPAGSCVAAPPGAVHGFRTPSGGRYLNLHAPGVFSRGFRAGLEPTERDTFGAEDAPPGVRGYISGPGDGERVQKPHRLALVKLEVPDLDVLEYHVDEEYDGAGPHLHLRHADCFHVLEGELEFRVDGETIRAGAGTTVAIPPGVVHEFTSVKPSRFLNVHAPESGFVEYLRGTGDPARFDSHEVDVETFTRST